MAREFLDNDPLVQARHALQPLWVKIVGFKGRCWGQKTDSNPFPETNITFGRALGEDGECVTICKIDGRVKVYSFQQVEENKLKREIERILRQVEIRFQELSLQYLGKWIALDVYAHQLIGTADDYRGIMDILREKNIKRQDVIVEHLTLDRQPIV